MTLKKPSEGLVERLRRLDAAATAGPWERSNEYDYLDGIMGEQVGLVVETKTAGRWFGGGAFVPEGSEADSDLIVAMRNALPRLLAVIEAAQRLRASEALMELGEDLEPIELTDVQDRLCDALDALEVTK